MINPNVNYSKVSIKERVFTLPSIENSYSLQFLIHNHTTMWIRNQKRMQILLLDGAVQVNGCQMLFLYGAMNPDRILLRKNLVQIQLGLDLLRNNYY